MTDFLILAVVAAIVTASILYIRKQKKSGAKCIGCPHSRSCSGNCGSCSDSCTCHNKK
jgi:hypothetical protein